MKINEIISILENYNAWRRGEDTKQPEPKIIGFTIDEAIEQLKKAQGESNENKQL